MWEATQALLTVWWQREASHAPARQAPDDTWAKWNSIVAAVEDHFGDRSSGSLNDVDNEWLGRFIEEPGELPYWDVVHALAWGLDAVGWASFTEDWLPPGHIRELELGMPYPVSDIDLHVVGDSVTSRPGSLGPDVEELPHVRRFRGGGSLSVVFDATHSIRLRSALEGLERIVTVHPNATLEEFDVPLGQPVHGVAPTDLEQQRRLLTEALEREMGEGALIVLPELSVTQELVDQLEV